MDIEKLREELRQAIHAAPTHPLAELLNRAFVALGEQQSVAKGWWQVIHDTLRNYSMTTLVDEEGNGYPLIDAMTADSQTVSGGIEECTYLADAIWNALIAAAPSPVQGAWKLVPVELLEELRDAANEAHNEATRPNRIKFFAALVEKADAILDAPSAPAAQGWIPVSERLPEEDQPVLVFHENDGPDFDVMWQHNSFWFGNSDQFYSDGERFYQPTHWMPLPAAPIAGNKP